jgi:hypothetical protein
MNTWPKTGRNLKVRAEMLGGLINAWEFPSLDNCRAVFERATGVKGEW